MGAWIPALLQASARTAMSMRWPCSPCNRLAPDGNTFDVLIGGEFGTVDGQAQTGVARLFGGGAAPGSLDAAFAPGLGSGSFVECIVVQPDGRVLLGGALASDGGAVYSPILRFDVDGSPDPGFNTGLPSGDDVKSIALQANGGILLGGGFSGSNVVETDSVVRLQANGSLDPTFNPGAGANALVDGVALQASGEALIAGYFTSVNGTAQNALASLLNDSAGSTIALQNSAPDTSLVIWQRNTGSAPEVQAVTFEVSTDGGTTWNPPVAGEYVAGNWQFATPTLPAIVSIRATGRSVGGFLDGSSGLVQQIQAFPLPVPPLSGTADFCHLRSAGFPAA